MSVGTAEKGPSGEPKKRDLSKLRPVLLYSEAPLYTNGTCDGP